MAGENHDSKLVTMQHYSRGSRGECMCLVLAEASKHISYVRMLQQLFNPAWLAALA